MSIESEVRAAVVATGVVGERAWRGRAPDSERLPYFTFFGPLSSVPSLLGSGRTMARRRQVQGDLWQDPTDEGDPGANAEAILNALDGLRVPTTPRSFRLRVTQMVEVPDPELIHHSFTIGVDHLR
ncbi:MAG TPA: hypothetical protein VM386_03995 [Acidimicrobiales bacterium]|nr:hypothetical protein [Acidimicrobiales bacterium]